MQILPLQLLLPLTVTILEATNPGNCLSTTCWVESGPAEGGRRRFCSNVQCKEKPFIRGRTRTRLSGNFALFLPTDIKGFDNKLTAIL